MTKKYDVTRSIQVILFAYPLLLLTVKGAMSTSFFLLLALSIYLLSSRGKDYINKTSDQETIWIGIALSATFISVLLSQCYNSAWDARAFDSPSRLAFSFLIFVALREIDFKVFGILQYGIALGAILIGIIIWMSGQQISARSYFLIHIHLGNLALMLGILSLFSINWMQKDSRWLLALKLLGMLSGVYVSLISGARGGWAAIPAFLLAWALTSEKFRKGLILKLAMAIGAVLLAGILSYHFNSIVHVRLGAAISDLESTDPDTSLGVRFQLWRAAIELFIQHPIFGVGADGFAQAMDSLASSGYITRTAAEIGKGEVHSYYFATLARYGLAGLLSILTLFMIPLRLFYRARSSQDDFRRVAARMGLAVVLGFAIYCVTVEMFNLKMVATFYGMTTAVLLAAVTNRSLGPQPTQSKGLPNIRN